MNRFTSFLWSIHRAVFEPPFYRELRGRPLAKAFFFFCGLVLLSSVIIAAAHTWYFTRPLSGFAAQIDSVLGGVSLKGGTLVPARQTPYVIPPQKLKRAIELSGGSIAVTDLLPDSFLVVDTGGTVTLGPSTSVHVLLSKTHLLFNPHTVASYAVSYAEVFGVREITISRPAVQHFIERRLPAVFIAFVVKDVLFNLFNSLSALLFLFLAAFILKIDGFKRLSDSLSFATYASVPVILGVAIEAVAGTQISGAWFFFMMISLFVLFRGVRSCLIESREREKRQ